MQNCSAGSRRRRSSSTEPGQSFPKEKPVLQAHQHQLAPVCERVACEVRHAILVASILLFPSSYPIAESFLSTHLFGELQPRSHLNQLLPRADVHRALLVYTVGEAMASRAVVRPRGKGEENEDLYAH